ncbi:hypothetical protein K9N68_29225 [Kovacikia minuta CCNUW1]|uniref:hypothetical protein n=1 Tax=Kovacikia minuta TaxID=2931930 RepID=UPI001CCD0AE2|nr:hypothetical protein [Kovacikia minuta]UBF25606.1 hypothetical protein K9N68_29225 [Kovacikia minuta CCNUW1]
MSQEQSGFRLQANYQKRRQDIRHHYSQEPEEKARTGGHGDAENSKFKPLSPQPSTSTQNLELKT